jgi:antitoxin (DNA-binding transcriptional repressor) of toxin-antitoxin stability system
MQTLSVGEFKSRFSDVLVSVKAGDCVGVSYGRKGALVAVLVPPSSLRGKAGLKLGVLRGRASFAMASDFEMSDEELLSS